jgi:hypothetical protein
MFQDRRQISISSLKGIEVRTNLVCRIDALTDVFYQLLFLAFAGFLRKDEIMWDYIRSA